MKVKTNFWRSKSIKNVLWKIGRNFQTEYEKFCCGKSYQNILKKFRDVDFDVLIRKMWHEYVHSATFSKCSVLKSNFLKIAKISIFLRSILETLLKLSKKPYWKWVLKLEIYKKICLAKFRKWSKMCWNWREIGKITLLKKLYFNSRLWENCRSYQRNEVGSEFHSSKSTRKCI